jgi:hypothetical protein
MIAAEFGSTAALLTSCVQTAVGGKYCTGSGVPLVVVSVGVFAVGVLAEVGVLVGVLVVVLVGVLLAVVPVGVLVVVVVGVLLD